MSYGKSTKKRSTMAKLQSVLDGENYLGIRGEVEGEFIQPPFKTRLRELFRQIEKEFDILYAENLSCKFLKFYCNIIILIRNFFNF